MIFTLLYSISAVAIAIKVGGGGAASQHWVYTDIDNLKQQFTQSLEWHFDDELSLFSSGARCTGLGWRGRSRYSSLYLLTFLTGLWIRIRIFEAAGSGSTINDCGTTPLFSFNSVAERVRFLSAPGFDSGSGPLGVQVTFYKKLVFAPFPLDTRPAYNTVFFIK